MKVLIERINYMKNTEPSEQRTIEYLLYGDTVDV